MSSERRICKSLRLPNHPNMGMHVIAPEGLQIQIAPADHDKPIPLIQISPSAIEGRVEVANFPFSISLLEWPLH